MRIITIIYDDINILYSVDIRRKTFATTHGRREKTANGKGINRRLVLRGAIARRNYGKETKGEKH